MIESKDQKKIDQTVALHIIKIKQDSPQNIVFPQKIIKLDKYGNIKISNGEWKWLEVSQFLKHIDQWFVQQMLYLSRFIVKIARNDEKLIIHYISDIKFPKLKQIYLGNNQIESLQLISQIYAPLLQVLWVQDNLITSLRPLKRADFPYLSYIRITGNFLSDCLQLADIQMNFFNTLLLEYNKFGRVQFQDLSAVAKYNYVYKEETQSCLYGFSMNRIFQPSLMQSLKRKILIQFVIGFNALFT